MANFRFVDRPERGSVVGCEPKRKVRIFAEHGAHFRRMRQNVTDARPSSNQS
jgi:hypothetical protein